MTQEELAKTMGKSQSSVANKLRLLSLPEEIQNALLKEQISERHARALLSVPDQNAQKELMTKVMTTKMSVRALEDEIQMLYPKGKDAAEIPIDLNATAGGFLNTTPLTPTTNLEVQSDNYGKVVIAPPQETPREEEKEEQTEEVVPTDRFVNYGEIGKDTNPDIGLNGATIPTETQHVDVNDIKEKAEDIKPTVGGAALDNLLHIQTNTPRELSKEEQAEKENYFQSPDLPAIKIEEENAPLIPSINIPAEADTMIPGIVQQEGYSIEEATNKLKAVVDELKEHGVKIHADEMNFPKSYQIIIKIDKE